MKFANCIVMAMAAFVLAGCALEKNSAAETPTEKPGVKISSFGYDPADSTRFIQRALDSGEPKLILDRQAGPWVTLPLKMRSNTELVIEPGVELLAKRGEYKGLRDYLLELPYATNVTIRGGAGATLRMWKKDYQGPDYKHGEWRYALRIFHCKNVLVEGLNIVESGGDGIGITGEDIVIRNCVCDKNHRQGISLFNAKNLLIENCVLSNTSGTPPQSGIDIEPDTNKERLENVVLRNVVASGNAGCGFELYLNNLDDSCPPIDIRFENCHAIGNTRSACVNGGGSRASNFVKGKVVFDNCLFEGAKSQAINVSAAVRDGYDVAFKDCVVSNAFPDKLNADVRIGANFVAQGNPDGIFFDNLKIYQPTARNWFVCSRGGIGARSDRISGNVKVFGPDGQCRQVTLDDAWRKANLPLFNHGQPLPSRAALPKAAEVTVCDRTPGELAELQPVTLLYGARMIFFMEKPGKARFTARQVNVVKGRALAKKPLQIFYAREDGKKGHVWKIPVPGAKETAFEFEAPKTGFYFLEGSNEGTRFQLMKASVPVAIDFSRKGQMTARLGTKPFSLWLDSPGGAAWSVLAAGDDYYRFKLKVADPAGKTVDEVDPVDTAHVVSGSAVAPAGRWRFDFSRGAMEHYDWVNLDVFGAPPYLFLCEGKQWKVTPGLMNHVVHRGWGLAWPENSMLAIKQCWQAGFIPELDARISKDGVLFAFHDANYKGRPIGEMTWAEIRKIDIAAPKGKNWQWRNVRPPTWDDIFAEMAKDPGRRVAMDYKCVPNEKMLACAKKYGVERQIVHNSGSARLARDWKRLLPGGRTLVWLYNGQWKPVDFDDRAQYDKCSAFIKERFENLAAERFEGVDMVSLIVHANLDKSESFCPDSAYLKKAFARVRSAGKIPCAMVWTQGEREEVYRRLVDLGAEMLATDYPTALQRHLGKGDVVKAPENVPELLKTASGKVVVSSEEWEKVRRPEILKTFTEQEFGVRPVERPASLKFTPICPDQTMMGGAALRKRARISYEGPRGKSGFDVTCFIPTAAKKPAGAFVLICNREPGPNIDPERKVKCDFWPAEEIVARGYAAVAFYNGEVAEDSKTNSFATGVYTCFGPTEAARTPTSWATISAWAWGASRVLDWLETIPQIDAKRVAVVGHSRGGKTSLWAAASDRRFAMACVNDSGCAGAKLNRADLPESESIERINLVFPHWFCLNYRKYGGREKDMPFDQHQLVALLAPRPVCIASATRDNWAGQSGEFFSGLFASDAWKLYGMPGLVAPKGFPPPNAPLQEGMVSYHLRDGVHVLNQYDWDRYMDAADKWMK